MALAYKYEVLPSSNHSARSNFKDYTGEITHICIHHWGIDGQHHDNVVAWLRGKAGGQNNDGSSAHYVCSAGKVTNLVAEDRAAWAAIGAILVPWIALEDNYSAELELTEHEKIAERDRLEQYQRGLNEGYDAATNHDQGD